MRPAATYDLETQDWTTFVLGAIHYADGRTVVRDWRRERDLADELLEIEGEVWAHNGGRFDHLWLLDSHPDREASITANASGIVTLRFEGSPAVFCDSMRVFPFSLATLTGGTKGSLADLCACGQECGGYCRIRRDMSAAVRRRVEDYLVADVRELMRALDHFAALSEAWGFELRHTLGATSWASASRELGLPAAKWSRRLWAEIREAYHGGRAEVFRRWAPVGHAYDVNSMYPWALTEPVPVGVPRELEGSAASAALRSGKPGVYRATVRVPADSWIPPLPIRTDSGLVFPVGQVRGYWPLPELVHATLQGGARVERVHSAIVWPEEAAIFRPWVERIYRLRMEHGKDSREGKWLKWVPNSLTGKLGTRAESRNLRVNPDLSRLPLCRCDSIVEPCRCGGWRPLDETGRVWEQVVQRRTIDACAHPEWAAYLTGRARVKLHAQLDAPDAVYCDTDSVWSVRPRGIDVGAELGEWDHRGRFRNFEALGPKSYRVELAGETTIAMKGIPSPKWETIMQGVPQRFRSIAGLRRPVEGRFFALLDQSRTVTPNTGTREVRDPRDPRTWPTPVVMC